MPEARFLVRGCRTAGYKESEGVMSAVLLLGFVTFVLQLYTPYYFSRVPPNSRTVIFRTYKSENVAGLYAFGIDINNSQDDLPSTGPLTDQLSQPGEAEHRQCKHQRAANNCELVGTRPVAVHGNTKYFA